MVGEGVLGCVGICVDPGSFGGLLLWSVEIEEGASCCSCAVNSLLLIAADTLSRSS